MNTMTTLENNIPWINSPKIDREIGVVWWNTFNVFSTTWTWVKWTTQDTITCPFKPRIVEIYCRYTTPSEDYACMWYYSEEEEYCHMVNENKELFQYFAQPIKLSENKTTDGSIEIDLSPDAYFDIEYFITVY